MRKNKFNPKLDKKLTMAEKKQLDDNHYEKPEFICDCGYHKNSCVCAFQKQYKEQQEKQKEVGEEPKEREVRN